MAARHPQSRRPRPVRVVRAALVAILAISTRAGNAGTPQDAAPPSVGDDVAYHSRVLLNASIDGETRRGAAARLVQMNHGEAVDALDQGLRSRDGAVILAIVAALDAHGGEIPTLADAAFDALMNGPDETVDRLAVFLVRTGPEAQQRMADGALRDDLPEAQRLRLIRGLAWARGRSGAADLMRLLERERDEPPEIVAAACASLERISGLTHLRNASDWRAWWEEDRNLDDEQWLLAQANRLSERITELERSILEERTAAEALERRLYGTYRDLFPRLPRPAQLELLPGLLVDDLAPVREFAMSRLDVFQRDAEPIPEAIQSLLLERLADPEPALRARAATLLADLLYPQLGDHIAVALASEEDHEVVRSYLAVLTVAPSPTALGEIRRRLGDANVRSDAADALWELIETHGIEDAERIATLSDLRVAFEGSSDPRVARVLARIEDGAALAAIEERLDGDDTSLRAAIAEGLRRRGRDQPLLDRITDPAVYPFAAAALAAGPVEMDALQRLLETPAPTESLRPVRLDAIGTLALRFPAPRVLAVDEMLSTAGVPLLSRARVIEAHLSAEPEGLSLDVRTALLERAARLRVDLGDLARAHELLEQMNGTAQDEALTRLRFEVALRVGAYDAAASLDGDPARWVEIFLTLTDHAPDAAAGLCDEIRTRFPEMSAELRAQFDSGCERIADAGDDPRGG